jgi:hypothetical protein
MFQKFGEEPHFEPVRGEESEILGFAPRGKTQNFASFAPFPSGKGGRGKGRAASTLKYGPTGPALLTHNPAITNETY